MPTVAEEPIGTVIAKRRHVLGLSQAQFAAKVGVTRDTVSMWERNRQFPHRHLGKVEEVLGIPLTGPPLDETERQLLSIPDLPPELREEFLRRYREIAQARRHAG
jgi:transcriptional regulator with XRE-family HTH domain